MDINNLTTKESGIYAQENISVPHEPQTLQSMGDSCFSERADIAFQIEKAAKVEAKKNIDGWVLFVISAFSVIITLLIMNVFHIHGTFFRYINDLGNIGKNKESSEINYIIDDNQSDIKI